ncbi:MAG: pantetheine-phosphate adenylyltransferase [Ignavibacteriales bacterium]|nr:pantetheine-phosphate adenylyltransferase [Ignavibacteriales bacterium]
MKIALYPGTFDPITNGHIDIIDRARDLFDKVVVTVAVNANKSPLFGVEERVEMIQTVIRQKRFNNVTVESFDGLLVRLARKRKATALIRGLRATSDFEYEFQMALMNRKQEESIMTVFLMPHEKYTYLTSSIVREVARLNGKYKQFVPPNVYLQLKRKMNADI